MKILRIANSVIGVMSLTYIIGNSRPTDMYIISVYNMGVVILISALGALLLPHLLFEDKKIVNDGSRKSASNLASVFIGYTWFIFVFLLVGLLILSPQFTTNKNIDIIKVFIGIYLISNVLFCKYLFK